MNELRIKIKKLKTYPSADIVGLEDQINDDHLSRLKLFSPLVFIFVSIYVCENYLSRSILKIYLLLFLCCTRRSFGMEFHVF